jgi:prepilin-type processing-associated H-X9-DG protein
VAPNPAGNWSNYSGGTWYKQKEYTTAAERALVADCRAYVMEATQTLSANAFLGQPDLNSPGGTSFWVSSSGPQEGESSYDYYRHGTYPRRANPQQFSPKGGKVGFNILFADGHVRTAIDRQEGFKAFRMRFPG